MGCTLLVLVNWTVILETAHRLAFFSKRKVSETGSVPFVRYKVFLDCWAPQKELIAFAGHGVKL